MMFRRFALLAGLLVAALASQLPEFAQQYRQRLGGAIDELSAAVAQFDAEASALSLTREQAIERLRANDDILAQERGASVAEGARRRDRLERQRQAFQADGPVARYVTLAEDFDPAIARQAYGDFQPALPVTPDGLIAAAVGFLIGWALVHLVTLPIRRRRPRVARSIQGNPGGA